MKADANCRSCGRPIRWVITEPHNKRMPMDPIAVPDGNCWIDRIEGGTPIVKVALSGEGVPSSVALRYISHFVTCEHADSWRKR